MIAGALPSPPMPRKTVPASGPAASAPAQMTPSNPVQAGGGDQLRLNEHAQIEVTRSVLGFLPVTVKVDVGEILSGKYGRDFQMTSVTPDWVRVTGQASFGPFSQAVDEMMPMRTGGAIQGLAVHLGQDGLVHLGGQLKVLGIPLPFTCALVPQRESQEVFQFKFANLRVGSGDPVKLPATIGAWLTSAALTIFGKIEGVTARNMDTLQVDFGKMARANPGGPPPTLPA
jgi:hypothetical protein